MSKRGDIATKAEGSGAFSSPGSGAVLDKHDFALAAPTAASGIFNQRVWSGGKLVDVYGTNVPIYVTPEIANLLYIMWDGYFSAADQTAFIGDVGAPVGGANAKYPNLTKDQIGYITAAGVGLAFVDVDEASTVNQIKSANMLSKTSLTTEDLLYSMARTLSGRLTLMKYSQPSDIFITNGGVEPMFVASYFYKYYGLTVPAGFTGGFHIDSSVNANTFAGKETLVATLKAGSIRTRRS